MNCARSNSEINVEPTPFLNILFKSLMDVFLSSIYSLPFSSHSPPAMNLNSTSVSLVLIE